MHFNYFVLCCCLTGHQPEAINSWAPLTAQVLICITAIWVIISYFLPISWHWFELVLVESSLIVWVMVLVSFNWVELDWVSFKLPDIFHFKLCTLPRCQLHSLNLSRRLAPGLFSLGFSLQIEESGSPQILSLPIAESSVVHKILLKTFFKGFALTFCGKSASPLFPARWNSVLHGNQAATVESGLRLRSNWARGQGSISFIMHHQKPGAVFPASQRCSEGGQSCCRVRGSALKLWLPRTRQQLWPPSEHTPGFGGEELGYLE